LLRAFLLAVFFGLACFGAIMLLKRFLPELFDGSSPVDRTESGEVSDTGRLVNIVLPGGEELQELSPDTSGSMQYQEAPGTQAGLPDRTAAAAMPDEQSGSLESDVQDIRSESLLLHGEGSGAADSMGPRPSVALDELDVLPDLDSLTDSFVASSGDIVTNDDVAGSPSPYAAGSAGSDKGDPALLAKAVQTLLRRDQKG
jgi:hypothetical protein